MSVMSPAMGPGPGVCLITIPVSLLAGSPALGH